MLTVIVLAALLAVVRRRRSVSRRARTLVLVAAVLGFNLALGAPAMAQDRCVPAPEPERPGTGLVGVLDPSKDHGEPGSPYAEYGYAGMVWHFHENTCRLRTPFTDPSSTFDTWLGNELFNIAKNMVGITNSLHYMMFEGGPLDKLYELIKDLAGDIFRNIYLELFSICMLIVAVTMFRQIWRGDFAALSRRTLTVFGCVWFASSSVLMLRYSPDFDKLLLDITNGIRTGMVAPEANADVLPTLLHTKVVHENWLRGEFGGTPTGENEELGRRLLAAQAWTWDDLPQADGTTAAPLVNQKKEEYKAVVTELGTAAGQVNDSRVGAAFFALLQALVYSLFQMLTNLTVCFCTGMLKFMAVLAPIVGVVGLFKRDILRRVVIGAATQLFHLLILVMLAGIHFWFLQLLFAAGNGLPVFTQMLLAGAATLIFMIVGRPIRRLIEASPLGDARTLADLSAAENDFWGTLPKHDARPVSTPRRGPRPESIAPANEPVARAENELVVPSQLPPSKPRERIPSTPPVLALPPAETEVVGGRRGYVVYRPSRGLEVIDVPANRDVTPSEPVAARSS